MKNYEHHLLDNVTTFDWGLLRTNLVHIHKKIKEDWNSLLEQDLKEHKYQEFLTENAGVMLAGSDCYQVISKLKLGSEYETDFVIINEGYSSGIVYEIIEIETPYDPLFTMEGIPTKRFNCAIQQIRDWKRWLIDNRSYFQKFLPNINKRIVSNSNLKFKIIIGRRNVSDFILEKRAQIASEMNIEIRSFDSLTDNLSKKTFDYNYNVWLFSPQIDELSVSIRNELSNPFFSAINDSKWKEICTKKFSSTHYYSNNYKSILRNRRYSKYFDLFCQELQKLSKG